MIRCYTTIFLIALLTGCGEGPKCPSALPWLCAAEEADKDKAKEGK